MSYPRPFSILFYLEHFAPMVQNMCSIQFTKNNELPQEIPPLYWCFARIITV